jgi:hypothetical protein
MKVRAKGNRAPFVCLEGMFCFVVAAHYIVPFQSFRPNSFTIACLLVLFFWLVLLRLLDGVPTVSLPFFFTVPGILFSLTPTPGTWVQERGPNGLIVEK